MMGWLRRNALTIPFVGVVALLALSTGYAVATGHTQHGFVCVEAIGRGTPLLSCKAL